MKLLLAVLVALAATIAPTAAYWQSRDSGYNAPPSTAAFYTATGPSTGVAGANSTNFTVTLASGTFNGSQTITIADGSSSGVITPSVGSPGTSTVTVTPTAATNSFSFTYNARQNGIFTLTFTNAQAWANPPALSYTATETYTATGPTNGANLVASTNFTVTLGAAATFTGAQTVTIADGAQGGTFTPSVGGTGVSTVTVTPTVGLTSFTFTYTPASTGAKTLTFTNAQSWSNPTALVYTVGTGPLSQIIDPVAGAATSSGSPTVATSSSAVPIGALVIFELYPNTTGTTITSVTDQGTGGSNTYTVTQAAGVGGVTTIAVASAVTRHPIPLGSSWIATTSDGSQFNPRGVWFTTSYIGGLDTATSVNQATPATAVAGLSSGVLANAADLVIGAVSPFSSTSGSITAPGGSWLNFYNNGHTHLDYALPAATTSLAYAPTWTTSSNYSAVELSFKPTPAYTGPGDVTGNWLTWHGLRAFSSATRGAALVNVCNSTGGVDVGCADLASDPATGNLVPATVSGITCPGANCTIKTWYDQVGSLNPTQATVAFRATLGASCIGSLPCATGVDIVNGIYSTATGVGVTDSVPWSMTAVAFWPSGSNATVQAATLQAQTTFNDRLGFVATTNLVRFECGTAVTQAITPSNWFAMTGVCNGASGIFAVNATTNTAQSAGTDALTPTSNTYTLMRKTVGNFVEGGVNSVGLSTGTITSLHSNERTYWGF